MSHNEYTNSINQIYQILDNRNKQKAYAPEQI